MVEMAAEMVAAGVVVVAKDQGHAEEIGRRIAERGVTGVEVMREPVNLTADSGSSTKIIVVPLSKCEGYSLTKMAVMIRSVYPSNNATRVQMEGRINRIGQRAEEVTYYTVHGGLLTRILNDHTAAKSIHNVLEALYSKE